MSIQSDTFKPAVVATVAGQANPQGSSRALRRRTSRPHRGRSSAPAGALAQL